MAVAAKDVQRERTQIRHFQIAREKKKESWKLFAPMYVVRCHLVHLVGMYTMFLLLMDILYEEQICSIQQVQGIESLDRKPHKKEDQDFSIK